MTELTDVEQFDQAVAQKAAPARRNPVVKALGWLSEVADQPQLIAVCSAVLLIGVSKGDRRLARAGGMMLASELIATKMKSAVKHRVDRTRPSVVDDGGTYTMKPGASPESDMNSFPSGHTAGAVTVARAFAREYPEFRMPAYALAASIAAVQVPRCRHYPSDLAAGALIGVLGEATVHAAWQGLARLRRVTTPSKVRAGR